MLIIGMMPLAPMPSRRVYGGMPMAGFVRGGLRMPSLPMPVLLPAPMFTRVIRPRMLWSPMRVAPKRRLIPARPFSGIPTSGFISHRPLTDDLGVSIKDDLGGFAGGMGPGLFSDDVGSVGSGLLGGDDFGLSVGGFGSDHIGHPSTFGGVSIGDDYGIGSTAAIRMGSSGIHAAVGAGFTDDFGFDDNFHSGFNHAGGVIVPNGVVPGAHFMGGYCHQYFHIAI